MATKSVVRTSIQCSTVTMGLFCSVCEMQPQNGQWMDRRCQLTHIWSLRQPSNSLSAKTKPTTVPCSITENGDQFVF